MDFQKKDWQFRDIISEDELNRMEDGIEEGITKAEQAQQTADDAATAAANAQSDIDDYKNEIRSLGLGIDVDPRTTENLDLEVQPGWVTTRLGTIGIPPGGGYGVVRIDRRNENRVAQTYYHLSGEMRTAIFTRILGGNGWTDWVQILHTGNTTNIVNQEYETGTWTPTLEGLDVPGNHTYSTRRENYHIIGDRVFISGELRITSSGFDSNMSGGIVISGLPFAQRDSADDSTAFATGVRSGIDPAKSVYGYIDRGENVLSLFSGGISDRVRITHEDLSTPIHISFSGHYRI